MWRKGAKVFALGWDEPISPANWTDDDSSYVEIHGGPAATFDDSVTLGAGGHVEWTEFWYPVAGLGGLRHATRVAALNLTAGGGQVRAAVVVTRPWSGDAVIQLNGQERTRESISLVPGQLYYATFAFGDDAPATGRLVLRLEAAGGEPIAEYSADYRIK